VDDLYVKDYETVVAQGQALAKLEIPQLMVVLAELAKALTKDQLDCLEMEVNNFADEDESVALANLGLVINERGSENVDNRR
jgi:hypothetical protein